MYVLILVLTMHTTSFITQIQSKNACEELKQALVDELGSKVIKATCERQETKVKPKLVL